VVEAGVLATANSLQNKNANILLIGTNATVSSKAYENALLQLGFSNLHAKATPLFVQLVEENILEGKVIEAAFEHYFSTLKTPDALILGCTHFPLLKESLHKYFGEQTQLIHSGDAIVEHLEQIFDFKTRHQNPELKFFASENPDALKKIANKWLYDKQ